MSAAAGCPKPLFQTGDTCIHPCLNSFAEIYPRSAHDDRGRRLTRLGQSSRGESSRPEGQNVYHLINTPTPPHIYIFKTLQFIRACSHYWRGGAGSQFFRVPEVRSDAYRVSANDDRRRNRENCPRPFGLRRKSGHTSFPPSTVDPPQSSGSASSGRFFARNAIYASSVNRP